ncbi:Deuterolysin metalloprotease family-domain-containing protein [Aspergillus spectabilis]
MAVVLFFHLLAVLTLASGKPVFFPRQAPEASQVDVQPSFDVSLQYLGNTSVKAQVTNVGNQGVRLVQRGGILDHVPTKKVIVKGGDTNPTFTGVRVEYILSHLTEEAFVQLTPNQTVASIFDIADLYALTPGQEYTAVADGILEYTDPTDPNKFRVFDYISNNITFTAPTDVTNRLQDRSTLICTDEHNAIVQEAITRAAEMATAAAADARSGTSALFEKFFKSTSTSDIEEVAGRLEAIAQEATSTGQLTYYCEPTEDDYCAGNVAAMMYPTLDKVVNCPGYYSSTKETNHCGYLDQAGITLHEYAHAESLFPPGTEDIVYGYEGVLALDTERAKNNADSFAYYASAVYLQCAADDSVTIGTALDVDLDGGLGGETSDDTDSDAPTGIDTTIWDNTDTDATTTTEPPTTTTTAPPPPETPIYTPELDPSNPPGTETGSGGWGWWGTHHGHDDTDPNTGTGGSGWSGGYWDNTSPPSSSASTAPVTTSSGDDLYNLNDLIEWLWAQYAGSSSSSSSTSASTSSSYGRGAGANTQVAQAEDDDCDE